MKYRKFVGDDPAAIAALRNYAAMSARRTAERPDGTLDPQKFGAWLVAHGDALRAVPEIRPQFSRIDQAAKELHRFTPFRSDLAPSAIPEMFFHSGPSGAEGVRQLRQLLGDQHANAILTDYAASRLKQAAMRDDGTLDPGKTSNWLKQHADALREMPGLADRFSTVAKATDAVNEAAALRKSALDKYQEGAVGKILQVSDPADVSQTVGRVFSRDNTVGDMRRLAQETAKNPDAAQGLRKAIVDFMYGKYVGNADALKSDAFQTFIRQNRPALSMVFKPDEIQNMSAIAADLARTRKAFDQARIPGQSPTAPDLLAAKGSNHEHDTLLDKLWKGVITGGEAGEHGAILGALAAIGSHVVGAMRLAGLKTSGDLLKEAILNKTGDGALAKALLMKAPIKPNVGSAVTLAHQLRRIAVLGAVQTAASH